MRNHKKLMSTQALTLAALFLATFSSAANAQTPELDASKGIPCPAVGTTTASEYVDLLNCLIPVLLDYSLADLDQDQQVALQEYAAVFDNARITYIEVLRQWVLPNIPIEDIGHFEFLVQHTLLLEELDALQNLHVGAGVDARLVPLLLGAAREKALGSVKKLIDKLLTLVPSQIPLLPRIDLPLGTSIGPISLPGEWLVNTAKMLAEVLCEIMGGVKGAKNTSASASVFSDGFEAGDTTSWLSQTPFTNT